MDLTKPIEDYDLVFLDLETTGLDVVMGDAICEIGAFKVRRRKIIGKFYSLINPKRSMPKQAYQVHKISDQQLKGAPYFEKVADKFIDFVAQSIVCAYNVEFDMGFIQHHLKDMNYPPLELPALDILSMARDALKLPRYNLETVASSLNIDCLGSLHRALEDAFIAYRTFFKVLDIFREKKIERLNEYISLYGFNNEIFKLKENQKIDLLKEAIQNNTVVQVKYFSLAKIIEIKRILPLRIFQEGRYRYLLYQDSAESIQRLKLRYLLDIKSIAK